MERGSYMVMAVISFLVGISWVVVGPAIFLAWIAWLFFWVSILGVISPEAVNKLQRGAKKAENWSKDIQARQAVEQEQRMERMRLALKK